MHASLKSAMGIFALACAGHAGVLFTQTLQDLEGRVPASTNLIRMDKGKVRIDAGQSPGAYLVYRGDKQVLWSVDLKAGTYTETSGKDFEAMAAKRDAALEKLKTQLQDLTPEQKKVMDEMLAKMGVAPKIEYKKSHTAAKVGAWPADRYEGLREGAKVSEIWIAAPADLGVRDEDVQPLKDMAGLFGKFSRNLSGMLLEKGNGLDGVPVKTVAFRDGKAYWETELKEARTEDLPASLFELPAGLTRAQPVRGG